MLWSCMSTTTLSALSKLVEAGEVGKIVALVSFGNVICGLGASPTFSAVYQATVKTWPPLAIYLGICFYIGALSLAIFAHYSLRVYKTREEQQEIQLGQRKRED